MATELEARGKVAALVGWAGERRGLVLALVFVFAVLGLIASRELELDALPDVTGNQVVVLTRAPGLTPSEVERTVTRPIEIALGGLPGLVEQRSLSRYGISSVTGVFADDINPWLDARLTKPERTALAKVIAARVKTRKPAAYLLKKTYMHGVPFYVDERVIIPRSYIAELLPDEVAAPARVLH